MIKQCPGCNRNGKKVKEITLNNLLKNDKEPGSESYQVCTTQNCNIVYFSESDSQRFNKDDLKVRFGLKEAESPRTLCYCFNHSVEEIESEIIATGDSKAISKIKTSMKENGCDCEITNPLGGCCMGEISKVIKDLKSKHNAKENVSSNVTEKELDCCDPKEEIQPGNEELKKNNSWIFQAGAVFSAILASSCCWLPAILIGAGFSSASVLLIEKYRWLFIALTLVLVGLAFYVSFKSKKQDDCCGESKKDNRKYLVIGSLAILVILASPYINFASSPVLGPTTKMSKKVVTLQIEGMTCGGCATNIEKSLAGQKGVDAISVDYNKKSAIIGFDPALITSKFLRSSIEKSGQYKTKELK